MKRFPAIRVLGALLIAAAVALHVLNVRAARTRAQGADALRALAAMPALQLGVQAPGAEGARGFQLCPPDAVPPFLARLAAAEPGEPPKDATLEYGFSLVLTNHVRALLRGVRAPASDELWLSLREAAPEGGDEAFRDWPPALVTGLVHYFFFPASALLGASGVVFMLIMLSSVSGVRGRGIPMTMILVAVLYLGQEICSLLFVHDQVSNLTHILGGLIGMLLGFIL